MNTDRWRQVEELFEEARNLEPNEQRAFLAKSCPDDEALREEVMSLIASHEASSRFLDRPAFSTYHEAEPEVGGDPMVGRRIGPYRLMRRIASGGMGVVYEAEQENPHRTVAVKILHRGQDADPRRIRLFRREVQTLARLKHSSIATIHDAGTTEDGLHYFAMELVPGESFIDYIRNRKPSFQERLDLFLKVCDAVGYAHQRGVIHRDLKPSNILVVEKEGASSARAEVKVLDFGLARIMDGDLNRSTLVTETGRIMGTLQYMSPEQCRGDHDEIDVRSDVYALGVMLYELMTDRPPYKLHGLITYEAVRVICEVVPPKPGSMRRSLRGDMETVVLKALEKEPGRRYQSVSALSNDIKRFMEGRPVEAHPPSTSYLLRRLIVRHKFPFAAAAALLLLILGFGIWMSALYVRAVDAEKQSAAWLKEADRAKEDALQKAEAARVAAMKAELNTEFLEMLFTSVAPDLGQGHDVMVRDILDEGAERLEKEPPEDPEVCASLQDAIGFAFLKLGLLEKAEPLIMKSWTTRKDLLGEKHRDTMISRLHLAEIISYRGDYEEAEAILREIVEWTRQDYGPDDPVTSTRMGYLALVMKGGGKFAEAEELMREVVRNKRVVCGEGHSQVGEALTCLGAMLQEQGKHESAEEVLREALDILRKTAGTEQGAEQYLANALSNLSFTLSARGNLESAEPLLREAVEIKRKSEGENGPGYIRMLSNLSNLVMRVGKYEEAAALCEEALFASRMLYGDRHPQVAVNLWTLALNTEHGEGAYVEADTLFQEALSIYEEVLGESHPVTKECRGNYKTFLRRWRKAHPESALHQ